MSKKGKHFGSNIIVFLLSLVIIYIDIFLSKNILFLLIPFILLILNYFICNRCRNFTFNINYLFILLLILLAKDFVSEYQVTYSNVGG